jgi:hypothetical protein
VGNSLRFWMKASSTLSLICVLFLLASDKWAWGFDITTRHYDALRTGWNKYETILTPSNVASSSFGLIATVTLDNQVDAQPLVVLDQTIKGKGTHTVVYIATEQNTVYAIDGNTGQILLSRNLGVPVPYSLTGYCHNNAGQIGIGATPVIDTKTGTLYLIADTLVAGVPVFRLFALNLDDLSDAKPSVAVSASSLLTNFSTYDFDALVSRSRSALLLVGDKIYAGFASYCDFHNTRGWLLGWKTATLEPLPNDWLVNSEAISPDTFFLTSIWMSGSGVASDGSSIYFVTGNSDNSGNTWSQPYNLTESAVKLSVHLTALEGYFTPDNYPTLDEVDGDFGSGGIMLLPPQTGPIPLLATAAGKDGILYLMNRDALGGYNTNTNAVLGTYNVGACWCGESYFTGQDGINRVVTSGDSTLQTWQVQTVPSVALVQDSWTQSINNSSRGGFYTTISSNGSNNGIIWAIGQPNSSTNNAMHLNAFDANTGAALVTDVVAGYWPNTQANPNAVPVVTNGKVYVASYAQLAIFGLIRSGQSRAVVKAAAAADQYPLPAGWHRVTGTVVSASGDTLSLSIRSGTRMSVDTTDALRSGHASISGPALIAVGPIDSGGKLHAQSISRAKPNPALWLPDR